MKRLPLRSRNTRNGDLNSHQNYGVKVPSTVHLDLKSPNIFETFKQNEKVGRYDP